jgi:hypothetical protein
MRKLNSVLSLVKMRRNVKYILVFSISWMFVLLYYLQGSGNKVRKPRPDICRVVKFESLADYTVLLAHSVTQIVS